MVLDTLGEGKITASEYSRVKAGRMLSIVDLSISTEELSRLRCDSGGESSSYDPHYDLDLNPTLSSILATVKASCQWNHADRQGAPSDDQDDHDGPSERARLCAV